MSRAIDSSVITELAKDAFNMAHLVSIDFSTPKYFTDYSHSIDHGGNTYLPSSHLLELSQVNETSDIQVGSFTINLSSVEQSFLTTLLSENYINREVTISRAILNSSGAIIGSPIPMYSGRIDGYTMQENGTSSKIALSAASHWSDFERYSGRRTNHNSQQIYFPGDDGFEFASNTGSFKWGEL